MASAVPILRLGGALIVTLQDALTDEQLHGLREELARRVGVDRARALVLDVSALDVMDSFATRTLLNIAGVSRLRGADVVIVGVQPDVAFAMVQLGLELEGIATALDLEDGLAILDERRSARRRDA